MKKIIGLFLVGLFSTLGTMLVFASDSTLTKDIPSFTEAEIFDVFPEAESIANDYFNIASKSSLENIGEPIKVYSDTEYVTVDGELSQYKIHIYSDGSYQAARASTEGVQGGRWEHTPYYLRLVNGAIDMRDSRARKMARLENVSFTLNHGIDNKDRIDDTGQWVSLAVFADSNGQGGYSDMLLRRSIKVYEDYGNAHAIFMSYLGDTAILEVGRDDWSFSF